MAYKSNKSKLISIRLPTFLYNDLKFISNNIEGLTLSNLIVIATSKDIVRYKEILKKNGYEQSDFNNNI